MFWGITGTVALANGNTGVVLPPSASPAVRSALGKVVLLQAAQPAEFVFETATGRSRYAGDGAAESAQAWFDTGNSLPLLNELQYAAGAVSAVLTPFAAAAGAVEAKNARLSDADLRQAETDLVDAGKAEAQPQRILQALQRAVRAKLHRELPALTQGTANATTDEQWRTLSRSGYDTGLELRADHLRLEKAGKSDTSYIVVIDGRVRLFRLKDGHVLYDEPIGFKSRAGLFLDWTLGQGAMFRVVTDSAYDRISEAVLDQVFLEKSVASVSTPRASEKAGTAPTAARTTKTSKTKGPSGRGVLEITAPPLTAEMVSDMGLVGLISTSTIPTRLQLQRPLTVNQAAEHVSANCAGVWTDDQDFEKLARYPVLDVVSAAVMTPPGVVGQFAGAAHGVPERKLARADQVLRQIVHGVNLHDNLRQSVASRINSLAAKPVHVLPKLLPPGREAECSQMSCYMAGTLSWLPDHQSPEYYLRSQGIDTVVEVYVMNPALQSSGVVNPPMAVTMDVRATLSRVQNLEPIYAVDIHYRGPEQKFTAWAKNDGEPLRQELAHCVETIAQAIVDQLAVPAWRGQEAPNQLAQQ